jgi:hypothetical protein
VESFHEFLLSILPDQTIHTPLFQPSSPFEYTMADRLVGLFINAGARLLSTNNADELLLIALELFRGALELTLHRGGAAASVMDGQVPADTTSAASTVIQRAALHLQNLHFYLNPSHKTVTDRVDCGLEEHGMIVVVPPRDRGYEPFIYKMPYFVPEDQPFCLTLLSCAIVYNIGLVHQWMDRDSPKTGKFYTIAAMLLMNDPLLAVDYHGTLHLRLALLNNFGVWCYEHGVGDSMCTCLEHLASALDREEQTDRDSFVGTSLMQCLRFNIQWLLTPLHGASAAA